jgi:hypothetical protein
MTNTDTRIDDRSTEVSGQTPRQDERPLTTEDLATSRSTETPEPPSVEPPDDRATRTVPSGQLDGQPAAPLFDKPAATELQERWDRVQAAFVDEPRAAVEQADSLVAELMKRLADSFASERRSLEGQWSRGDDVSTEDLRVALRRYRSFFSRLLSV